MCVISGVTRVTLRRVRVSDSELEVRDEHGPHGAHLAHRDPMAEPSVEWGWHGTFPRTARIGGWCFVVIFLLMLIGNHEGRVEDLWLVGLALCTAGVLVWDQLRRRASWRR
jgi:hypothetical protein